jgi:hypothetical protein
VIRHVETYSSSVDDVLGKQNALELDQEKVGELFQVFQYSLDSFLRQSVVLARAERAREALVENKLASSLSGSSD